MIYLRLFYEFFKVGLFAIGGGLATFPFLQKLSAATGWFSISELTDMIAVSETTPGPIGVNMATYAGYTTGGLGGGIVSTLGLITPSVIIILIIARFLDKFRSNFYVDSAFYGLRPAVMGLIAAAGFSVFTAAIAHIEKIAENAALTEIVDFRALLIFAAAFILIKKFKVSPILCLIGSAVAGVLIY